MRIDPAARLHLRPTQFVDTPVGLEGASRLAATMQWFAAYELIEGTGDRPRRHCVPLASFDALLEQVASAQADRLRRLHARIIAPRAPLQLGARVLRLDQPLVMGILNATPDSFSDGGAHADVEAAAQAGFDMAAAGAALVDVGGESTRPGAKPVWEGDEIARVVPLVERLAKTGTPVSIDTRKAAVMEAALAAGAGLVNDVAALGWEDRAAEVVAAAGCAVILMHSPDGRGGHAPATYPDVATGVFDWLEARIDRVVAAGVDRSRILVDPGIGFGLTLQQNLTLINQLSLFHGLGCPLVLGASRKRMVGALSNEAPVDRRLGGSVALALKGAEQGVQIARVHDVAETAQALRIWRGLRDQALVG